MQSIPFLVDYNPVFIDFGAIKIYWYGITYLIAFALYWVLGKYQIKHRQNQWSEADLSDFFFYGALGVIIGGRMGWYLFYNDISLTQDPWLLFKINDGGMSFHGGLIGVIVAMLYFKKKTQKTFFQIADFVAPLVPLGILSVRTGNFINGELWGRLTDKPWGMIFPNSLPLPYSIEEIRQINSTGQLSEFIRHPSPLYEAFGEGLITFIIVWLVAKYSKKSGVASATFLICYGLARFISEFFREPDSNRGFIAFEWLTMGQLLTIPLILIGITILFVPYKKEHQ